MKNTLKAKTAYALGNSQQQKIEIQLSNETIHGYWIGGCFSELFQIKDLYSGKIRHIQGKLLRFEDIHLIN